MKKTVGTETIYYFYAMGVLVSEFSTTNTGATAAASTDRTTYQTSDKLGTAVLLMAASGLVIENNRTLPYGEEWVPAAGSANEQKFTSYQRDGESGLDYAVNRYASNRNGRFQSVDQGPYLLMAPVSLNRYVMTLGDPVNYTDPDGMEPQSNDPPPYNPFASFLDWLLTRRLQSLSLLTGEPVDGQSVSATVADMLAEIIKQRGNPFGPGVACRISSPYGMRRGGFHRGIDVAFDGIEWTDDEVGTIGSPVYSITGGSVRGSGTGKDHTTFIIVELSDGQFVHYNHVRAIGLRGNQEIQRGTFLGRVNNDPTSEGPHVHLFTNADGAFTRSTAPLRQDPTSLVAGLCSR